MNAEQRNGFEAVYAGIARSRAYRDAVREAFPETPLWMVPYNAVGMPLLRRIAGALHLRKDAPLVDLACGMGGPGLWIAEQTGASLTGVDFSPAAVAAAAALARERGARARFLCTDATNTGLPTAAFDALMNLDALQFITPDAAVAEMGRLLRPGGVLAATTWEAVIDDHPLPTLVKDYEPYLAGAGLELQTREVCEDFFERQSEFFRAILAREAELREEGGEGVEGLLFEARTALANAGAPRRVRRVVLFAQKR